jgi:hypothetical protein
MNKFARERTKKKQNYSIHGERKEIKENDDRHHTTIINETNQK